MEEADVEDDADMMCWQLWVIDEKVFGKFPSTRVCLFKLHRDEISCSAMSHTIR
jgi:hypothetical protein